MELHLKVRGIFWIDVQFCIICTQAATQRYSFHLFNAQRAVPVLRSVRYNPTDTYTNAHTHTHIHTHTHKTHNNAIVSSLASFLMRTDPCQRFLQGLSLPHTIQHTHTHTCIHVIVTSLASFSMRRGWSMPSSGTSSTASTRAVSLRRYTTPAQTEKGRSQALMNCVRPSKVHHLHGTRVSTSTLCILTKTSMLIHVR